MNRSLALALVLAFTGAFAPLASAQQNPVDAARAKKSQEILEKIRKVDLLNQILPAAFTKEQLNKILPVIEKCRQLVRTTEQDEAKALLGLEPKLDDAIKAGIDKTDIPNQEYMRELATKIAEFGTKRRQVMTANTMAMTTIVMEVCNKGQQKAMGNSFNPRTFNPSLKLEDLTDEQRLQYYIQEILLDPLAYDILVQLSRKAS